MAVFRPSKERHGRRCAGCGMLCDTGISVTGPSEVHAAVLVSVGAHITDALVMVASVGDAGQGLIFQSWTVCLVCVEASPMELPTPGLWPDKMPSYVMLSR